MIDLSCARRVVALMAAAGAVWPLEALAAIRLCRAEVVGEEARAPDEAAAKRAALANWSDKAKRVEPHASWHVATDKSLECRKGGDDVHVCLARGHPCTIRQVTPRGTVRWPRGKPYAGEKADTQPQLTPRFGNRPKEQQPPLPPPRPQ